MNTNSLKAWLEKYRSETITSKCFGFGFSFLGGIIVLIITFGFVYYIAWLASGGFSSLLELFLRKSFKLSTGSLLVISSVFIVLLFIQNLRMNSWSWRRYSQAEFEVDPRLRSDAGDLGTFVDILARPRASANFIADLLVCGPRLLTEAFACLGDISQLKQMETDKCAEALSFITSRNNDVSYEEFCAASWGEQLKYLKNIDGIYFLTKGLVLSEELRIEFNNLT